MPANLAAASTPSTLPTSFVQILQQQFAGQVTLNASLQPYTSLRIGGIAAALVQPSSMPALLSLIALCKQHTIAFRILGGGTNVLVADAGYPGVIISTRGLQQYHFEPQDDGSTLLYSEAGVRASRLLSLCLEASLSGFEFAAGIPGSFGGVLWMNAGTRGGSVSQVFHSLEAVMDGDQAVTLTAADVHYSYRSANLPVGTVILGGRLRLQAGDKNQIANNIQAIKAYRQGQPLQWPNAGSIFRNPPGDYAGRLIEASGLKGLRMGGAMISEQHANFIINVDQAKASDVLALIERVKATVLQEHGVELTPEVEVL